MSLYENTKDMHHACEAHPFGQRMSQGNVAREEWAKWLSAFRVLHQIVDPALPAHMSRDLLIFADLSVLPTVTPPRAALAFAGELCAADFVTGAAYVLHGAHRSGGRVLAPTLVKRGLPCAHICYRDPEAAKEWVGRARSDAEAVDQAKQTFKCLLDSMTEIAAMKGRADVR